MIKLRNTGGTLESFQKFLLIFKNRAICLKVSFPREMSRDLIIVFSNDNNLYVHQTYSFSIVKFQKL